MKVDMYLNGNKIKTTSLQKLSKEMKFDFRWAQNTLLFYDRIKIESFILRRSQ